LGREKRLRREEGRREIKEGGREKRERKGEEG
jgi:hypothetical protein